MNRVETKLQAAELLTELKNRYKSVADVRKVLTEVVRQIGSLKSTRAETSVEND